MGRAIKFNRDKAVIWAMNEIWKNGFETFSVKSVSKKLGITRSSFYHSFKSREALFLEASNLYFELSPHYKLSNFVESNSPLVLLTRVFKQTCVERCNDQQHRGCLAVNSIGSLVGKNDKLGPFITTAVTQSINNFEALLDCSISKDELCKTTDTHQLAVSLQNTLIGLNTLSKVVTDEKDLWNAVKIILMALKVYRQ